MLPGAVLRWLLTFNTPFVRTGRTGESPTPEPLPSRADTAAAAEGRVRLLGRRSAGRQPAGGRPAGQERKRQSRTTRPSQRTRSATLAESVRREFRFASERHSASRRMLAEIRASCERERCRLLGKATVMVLSCGSDETQRSDELVAGRCSSAAGDGQWCAGGGRRLLHPPWPGPGKREARRASERGAALARRSGICARCRRASRRGIGRWRWCRSTRAHGSPRRSHSTLTTCGFPPARACCGSRQGAAFAGDPDPSQVAERAGRLARRARDVGRGDREPGAVSETSRWAADRQGRARGGHGHRGAGWPG
jgi:hypothetical protein